MKRDVTVDYRQDADGREIALIPLAGDRGVAKLFREDFDRLCAAGYSRHWLVSTPAKHSTAYIRMKDCTRSGKPVTVARIIARAGPKSVVSYRDGDPMNLRHDNLRVSRKRVRTRRTMAPAVPVDTRPPLASFLHVTGT